MLHVASGSNCQSLKILGKIMQVIGISNQIARMF